MAGCSTLVVITWGKASLVEEWLLKLAKADCMACVFDSVPPEVKVIWSAVAPIIRATWHLQIKTVEIEQKLEYENAKPQTR